MPFDRPAAHAAGALPLQFVHIQIAPLIDGQYSVAMEATRLDEANLEFVGEDLAYQQVRTLDEILAVIRENVTLLEASE